MSRKRVDTVHSSSISRTHHTLILHNKHYYQVVSGLQSSYPLLSFQSTEGTLMFAFNVLCRWYLISIGNKGKNCFSPFTLKNLAKSCVILSSFSLKHVLKFQTDIYYIRKRIGWSPQIIKSLSKEIIFHVFIQW